MIIYLKRCLGGLALLLVLAACGGPAAVPTSTAAVAGFLLTINDATAKEYTFATPPKIDCIWTAYMGEPGSPYAKRADPVWSQLTAIKAGHGVDANTSGYDCCSTRALIASLQEDIHHLMPDKNIPNPGPYKQYDPTQSPLVKPE